LYCSGRAATRAQRQHSGADWEGKGYVFASPIGGPLSPNTDFHVWKRLDVVIDSIMRGEAGGAARMCARSLRVTGTLLRKVAQRVGDALWGLPGTEQPDTEENTN
jgi:integrase